MYRLKGKHLDSRDETPVHRGDTMGGGLWGGGEGSTPRIPENYSFTGLKNVYMYNEENVNVKIHAVRNFFCYRGPIDPM